MYTVRSLKRQSVCWQLTIRECTSRKEIHRLDIGHGHAHPRGLSFREELRNWAVRHQSLITCIEERASIEYTTGAYIYSHIFAWALHSRMVEDKT